MGRKLYVGNLGYGVTDSDLAKMFEPHGTVESAQVIMDRDTGRSKGFAFVEMRTEQEAQAATAALNGKQLRGRALTVNEAYPDPVRPLDEPEGRGVRADQERTATRGRMPLRARRVTPRTIKGTTSVAF